MSLFPPLLTKNSCNTSSPSVTTNNSSTNTPSMRAQQQAYNCGSGAGTPVSSPSMPTASSMASASRRSSTVGDDGRFCSLPQSDGTPEVLISLCYLEDQSKVVVGVEKATGFDASPSVISSYLNNNLSGTTIGSPMSGNKAPDTFVRVSALSAAGAELGKHKSETVKANLEPVYNDTAVFHINRNDLETSNVLVQIFSYCGILRRKVLLGYVCVGGENANSLDAQQHWQDMIQGMGTTVDKWHNLMKPAQRN